MGGGDIDDATEPVLAHRRQHSPSGVKRRGEIDREDRVPLLDRKLFERRDMLNAGIVDEHVEPAVLVERGSSHSRDGIRPGHVGRRIADRDSEFGGDLVARFGDLGGDTEAVEHDRGSSLRQRAGNPESDAAGRARDKRNLARERPRRCRTLRLHLDIHGRPSCRDFGPICRADDGKRNTL
jgi:hypothetical protein